VLVRSRGCQAGLFALCVLLAACGSDSAVTGVPSDTTGHTTPTADTLPLRAYAAARGRYIGAATGSVLTMPGDSGVLLRTIVAREFDMLWTGTYMKFDYLRPNRSTYNFTQADSVVAFAARNQMVVRGHTLVWHQQIPGWITSRR
jgi:endo-1,4-beta-xylanase